MRRRFNIFVAAALAAMALAAPGDAKTLRWASQGDILSFDPFSQNESFNNTFNDAVPTTATGTAVGAVEKK